MKTIRALLAVLVLMGAFGLNATSVRAEEENQPVSGTNVDDLYRGD